MVAPGVTRNPARRRSVGVVADDALGDAFREALPVGFVLERARILFEREERGLDEDGRHRGAHEHVEHRVAHPAIEEPRMMLPSGGEHRAMHLGGDGSRARELRLAGEPRHEHVERIDRATLAAVLPRREPNRLSIIGGVEDERRHAAVLDLARETVQVNGDEEVGPHRVGDRRALLERDEGVVLAREDDRDPRTQATQHLTRAERDVERERGLLQAKCPRAVVVAAVTRIEHDTLDGGSVSLGGRLLFFTRSVDHHTKRVGQREQTNMLERRTIVALEAHVDAVAGRLDLDPRGPLARERRRGDVVPETRAGDVKAPFDRRELGETIERRHDADRRCATRAHVGRDLDELGRDGAHGSIGRRRGDLGLRLRSVPRARRPHETREGRATRRRRPAHAGRGHDPRGIAVTLGDLEGREIERDTTSIGVVGPKRSLEIRSRSRSLPRRPREPTELMLATRAARFASECLDETASLVGIERTERLARELGDPVELGVDRAAGEAEDEAPDQHRTVAPRPRHGRLVRGGHLERLGPTALADDRGACVSDSPPIYEDRASGNRYASPLDMVNDYLRRFSASIGFEIDPLDGDGYTEVRRGSAVIGINVLVEHGILLFLSRIMAVPREEREAFYRRLLELNFLVTSDASFAIDRENDALYLRSLRRLSALDYEEFEDLLQTMGAVADEWDDRLATVFGE